MEQWHENLLMKYFILGLVEQGKTRKTSIGSFSRRFRRRTGWKDERAEKNKNNDKPEPLQMNITQFWIQRVMLFNMPGKGTTKKKTLNFWFLAGTIWEERKIRKYIKFYCFLFRRTTKRKKENELKIILWRTRIDEAKKKEERWMQKPEALVHPKIYFIPFADCCYCWTFFLDLHPTNWKLVTGMRRLVHMISSIELNFLLWEFSLISLIKYLWIIDRLIWICYKNDLQWRDICSFCSFENALLNLNFSLDFRRCFISMTLKSFFHNVFPSSNVIEITIFQPTWQIMLALRNKYQLSVSVFFLLLDCFNYAAKSWQATLLNK